MKSANLLVTALAVILAGIVLILTCSSMTIGRIVVAGGILLIMAGLANIFFSLGTGTRRNRSGNRTLSAAAGWIAGIAAAILGVVVLLFRQTFAQTVGFVFAAIVLAGAIFQLYLLARGARPALISGWFHAVPMALTGAAVYIAMQNPALPGASRHIALVTGITFIFFGLASVTESMIIARSMRAAHGVSELNNDREP